MDRISLTWDVSHRIVPSSYFGITDPDPLQLLSHDLLTLITGFQIYRVLFFVTAVSSVHLQFFGGSFPLGRFPFGVVRGFFCDHPLDHLLQFLTLLLHLTQLLLSGAVFFLKTIDLNLRVFGCL